MNSILVVMMLLAAPASTPAPPDLVAKMKPVLGPQRTYDKKWTEDWVRRCNMGHQPYSTKYCACIVDSARFYWDFKTAKLVFKNVEEGQFVPVVYDEIERHCWRLHESRKFR